MSLITATKISLSQGGQTVLSDVDLTIERGEIVTIVGPNGSGKSTLLRRLIGAMRPSIGTVTPAKGLRVPQKLQIYAALPLTVRRFLGIPRRASKMDNDAALKAAGVSDHASAQMPNLSGGQFQRVLLARALLIKPDVLILDEAKQGLDHLDPYLLPSDRERQSRF